MAVTIDWATKVILVPTDFMSLIIPAGPGVEALYELDVNALRLALKDIEDSEGMPYPDTHSHNTQLTLSGTTYARSVEIINGYKVEFDDSIIDHYTVRCVGANHNIGDVKVRNTTSLIIGNSAGLITVASGSGLSVQQAAMLDEIWKLHGLDATAPLVVTATTRDAGAGVSQTIGESAGVVTVERV